MLMTVCICVPTARSPVFSHLSSSLQGLWTIRAFKAEERFQQAFDAHQDLHSGQLRSRPLTGLSLALTLWMWCLKCCVLQQRPGSCSWPLHAGLQYVWMECVLCLWPSQPLDVFFLKTVRNPDQSIKKHTKHYSPNAILSVHGDSALNLEYWDNTSYTTRGRNIIDIMHFINI